MSHIVRRHGVEYFEFDNTYVGRVSLTYTIKADNIEDAESILDSVAESLSSSGVIGMATADADAKLTKTTPGKVK
jgi:hypothetical protein